MPPDEVFSIFQDSTQTAFQFLVSDFAFRLDSIVVDDSLAQIQLIACRVRYRNETTEVTIIYDWYEDLRGAPQVICGRLTRDETGALIVDEAFNLDMLIAEKCPDKSIRAFSKDPIERIKQTLDSYGAIMAECANDELTGDFTIFTRLRTTLLDEMKGAVILTRN